MDELHVSEIVSSWGCKLADAYKAQSRTCEVMTTDGCKESCHGVRTFRYSRMARLVVGFVTYAPPNDSTGSTLAVVCQCPGCQELYWYHITIGMVHEFAINCPLWPQDQKEKLGPLD